MAKKKQKTTRKRRGQSALKRLTLGGSYPIRQGRHGGGGAPYFITRDPPPQKDVQLQLPPTMLEAFQEYMEAGREAARTAQEGAKAVEAGAKATSSVLDVAGKATPYVLGGGAAALAGAYMVAPETTTNLAAKATTNVVKGAVKTIGKVAANVATEAAKGTANAAKGAANAAIEGGKEMAISVAQIPANHLPTARKTADLVTGMTLASWLAYAGAGLLTGGNVPAAVIPNI